MVHTLWGQVVGVHTFIHTQFHMTGSTAQGVRTLPNPMGGRVVKLCVLHTYPVLHDGHQ